MAATTTSPIKALSPRSIFPPSSPPYATIPSIHITNSIPLSTSQNLQFTQSVVSNDAHSTVIRKKVPVPVKTTIEWEEQYQTAVANIALVPEPVVQQPIVVIESAQSYPLRKKAVAEPEVRERERSAPERSQYQEPEVVQVYTFREVPEEVIQTEVKHVNKEFEKIVYNEVPYEVEKIVTKDVIKHIEIPVEKVIEKRVPVERYVDRVVEVPIERMVEVPIERIVQIPIERTVEITVPVDKIVEVPRDRYVEVPVERIQEKIVYMQPQPKFETRKRVVQVPVMVMQEQEIEERYQVGYTHHASEGQYVSKTNVQSFGQPTYGAQTVQTVRAGTYGTAGAQSFVSSAYGSPGSHGNSPPGNTRTYTTSPGQPYSGSGQTSYGISSTASPGQPYSIANQGSYGTSRTYTVSGSTQPYSQ